MAGARLLLAWAGTLLLMFGGVATATAEVSVQSGVESGVATLDTPAEPPPAWFTPEFKERVDAAGSQGIEIPAQLGDFCHGVGDPADPLFVGVQAGGCMYWPNGCTMNFVFRDDAGADYIGTAGHCAGQGAAVYMKVESGLAEVPGTIAKVGTTVLSINEGVGRDFALVKIDPDFAVEPAVPVVGGPDGVFCGDDTGELVAHYGHGYHVAAEQGYPRPVGVVTNQDPLDFGVPDTGYEWASFALGGDSGSPVVQAGGGLAVGNLTHGVGIEFVPVPPLTYGTRMAAIMNRFLAGAYDLVNADGSTSRGCTSAPPLPPGPNQPPTAAFSHDCNENTCRFDGSQSSDPDGSVETWHWDFGDGGTATGVIVEHSFSAIGVYQVRLTVTDDDGATDTESRTVNCEKRGKRVRCS